MPPSPSTVLFVPDVGTAGIAWPVNSAAHCQLAFARHCTTGLLLRIIRTTIGLAQHLTQSALQRSLRQPPLVACGRAAYRLLFRASLVLL